MKGIEGGIGGRNSGGRERAHLRKERSAIHRLRCSRGSSEVVTSADRNNRNISNSMGKALEAILFDIDGTLADSDPIHFEVFQDILSQEGFNQGNRIEYVHDALSFIHQ